MRFDGPEDLRDFLALALDPGHGYEKRTPAKLAEVMPPYLRQPLTDHAPHIAALRDRVRTLEAATDTARDVYAQALGEWIIPPIVQTADGWTWSCPKTIGGCGHQDPDTATTEAAAQLLYREHHNACTAADPPTPA